MELGADYQSWRSGSEGESVWSLNPQPEYQLQVCGTTGEMMAPSRGGDQGNSEASWNFPAILPDHDKEGGKVI